MVDGMDVFLKQVTIRPLRSASIPDLKQLYGEAGWWDPAYDENPDFLDDIVPRSAVFMGAIFEKKLIGMGRALSDLVSDAYIQDVTVLTEYRGKGIGRLIIQALVRELRQNGVDWIGLIAEPETARFYEALGFEPLKDHTPLRYTLRIEDKLSL